MSVTPTINKLWRIQPKIHNYKVCEGGEQEYYPSRTDFVSKSSKFRELNCIFLTVLFYWQGQGYFMRRVCHYLVMSVISLTVNENIVLTVWNSKPSITLNIKHSY